MGLEPTRRCMALVGTLSKVVLGGRLGLSAVDRRNRAGVFFERLLSLIGAGVFCMEDQTC